MIIIYSEETTETNKRILWCTQKISRGYYFKYMIDSSSAVADKKTCYGEYRPILFCSRYLEVSLTINVLYCNETNITSHRM